MARTKKSKPGKGKQTNTKTPTRKIQTSSKRSEPARKPIGNNGGSPLDKLSGELRNSIWRYVLISSTPIMVGSDDPHQPALLRTCSQVRTEAAAIYFSENIFWLPMHGYNSDLGLKWCQLAAPYLQKGMENITWERCRGGECWDDMLVWLQRTHAGQVPDEPPVSSLWPIDERAFPLFQLVRILSDVPWETVEHVLECHKSAVEDPYGPDASFFGED